jgi:hypothetical protein
MAAEPSGNGALGTQASGSNVTFGLAITFVLADLGEPQNSLGAAALPTVLCSAKSKPRPPGFKPVSGSADDAS